MNPKFPFAERIRDARKARQLSQIQAAELVGISREMWGKYERGVAHPSGDVIARMDAAGFDVSYILGGARTKVSGVAETRAAYDLADAWLKNVFIAAGLSLNDPLYAPLTGVLTAARTGADVGGAVASLVNAYAQQRATEK